MRNLVGLLCLLSYLGPTVGAPATIDSPEECAKIGGDWQPDRDTKWVSFCFVQISAADCQRNGWKRLTTGDPTPCQIRLSPNAVQSQCEASGGKWGAHCGRWKYCSFPQEEQACTSKGGLWVCSGRPLTARESCIQTSSDGGRECTDDSQCKFGCLLTRPTKPDATNVVGQCATTDIDTLPSCRTSVLKGRVGGTICVD
jgi:hypothetical protein